MTEITRYIQNVCSLQSAFTVILSVCPCGVYICVKTCEVFLCFVAIVRVRVYYVDFFVFFVLRHWWVFRFLHWGWARSLLLVTYGVCVLQWPFYLFNTAVNLNNSVVLMRYFLISSHRMLQPQVCLPKASRLAQSHAPLVSFTVPGQAESV